MRLFIALRFDDNILDALSDYQDALRALGITGNYTRRENLHITLVRKFKNSHGVALPEAVIPQSRISRISLMRSDRGKHGMIYTEIGGVET